jgi:hemolysin III
MLEDTVHGSSQTNTESLPVDAPPNPRLRGWFHQVTFFLTVPAGILLITVAHTTAARVGATIYALSMAGLYGVSGAYHRGPWSPSARRVMKRLDHSMIYVLIAGTLTPFALLALHPPWSIVVLSVVWGGAAVGITLKMTRIDGFHVVCGALYIGLGWAVLLAGPQFVHSLRPAVLVLIAIGGFLYLSGAVVLLRNKPNPAPATFGYHEIWHSMVIAASACHYVAVLLVVLPAHAAVG